MCGGGDDLLEQGCVVVGRLVPGVVEDLPRDVPQVRRGQQAVGAGGGFGALLEQQACASVQVEYGRDVVADQLRGPEQLVAFALFDGLVVAPE
ncbi:MAG: hypothetical protein JWM64_981 [Frankiales bacterium]|nr:hypothetical protein [Frankiales bacterium]